MSTCTEIQSLLPLSVGGDLEPPLEAGVREHLQAGCTPCAAALADLERSRDALRGLLSSSPAPRVDLWPGLRAALQADGSLGARPRPVLRSSTRAAPRVWLSAAALLLAAGGIFFGLRPGAPEATPGPVAAPGVSSDLSPLLVGGPSAGVAPLGGLRRLGPDEQPFYVEGQVFDPRAPVRLDDLPLRRSLVRDPSVPTLAGDRQR